MAKVLFEWDDKKDKENQRKHGASFLLAQHAFLDPRRVIARDLKHSGAEKRHFCMCGTAGLVPPCALHGHGRTRPAVAHAPGHVSRIIGAGYWRRGRQIYEQENQIHG